MGMFTRSEDQTGQKTVPQPTFEKMVEHLAVLSEVHNNITPQGEDGEKCLDIIETRMLAILEALPEGQV